MNTKKFFNEIAKINILIEIERHVLIPDVILTQSKKSWYTTEVHNLATLQIVPTIVSCVACMTNVGSSVATGLRNCLPKLSKNVQILRKIGLLIFYNKIDNFF